MYVVLQFWNKCYKTQFLKKKKKAPWITIGMFPKAFLPWKRFEMNYRRYTRKWPYGRAVCEKSGWEVRGNAVGLQRRDRTVGEMEHVMSELRPSTVHLLPPQVCSLRCPARSTSVQVTRFKFALLNLPPRRTLQALLFPSWLHFWVEPATCCHHSLLSPTAGPAGFSLHLPQTIFHLGSKITQVPE